MSRSTNIYWPISSPDGVTFDKIAANQPVVAGNNIVLKTNVPPGGIAGAFEYNNIVRTIIIDVTIGVGNTTFTINGIGTTVDANGNPEKLLGPITEDVVINGVATGESQNIYTRINSITVDNNVTVSVGFGSSGITRYIYSDYNLNVTPIGAWNAQLYNNHGITYAVYVSLQTPASPNRYGNFTPFGSDNEFPNNFIVAAELAPPASANANAPIISPFSVIWTRVSLCTDDSMYFTYQQQGRGR
jgi:hypothetical protein